MLRDDKLPQNFLLIYFIKASHRLIFNTRCNTATGRFAAPTPVPTSLLPGAHDSITVALKPDFSNRCAVTNHAHGCNSHWMEIGAIIPNEVAHGNKGSAGMFPKSSKVPDASAPPPNSNPGHIKTARQTGGSKIERTRKRKRKTGTKKYSQTSAKKHENRTQDWHTTWPYLYSLKSRSSLIINIAPLTRPQMHWTSRMKLPSKPNSTHEPA